ncbi:MAG: hypothetical protein M1812_006493 [Candelaria pacifica]|nr:MAG: hypothetical protein M1812_006493 [Candelaria pacifica]
MRLLLGSCSLILTLFATRTHQVDIVLGQANNVAADTQICQNIPPGACCKFIPTGSIFQRQTFYNARFTGLTALDIASVWTYTQHIMFRQPGDPIPVRNCYGTVLDTHVGGGDWLYEDNDDPAVGPALPPPPGGGGGGGDASASGSGGGLPPATAGSQAADPGSPDGRAGIPGGMPGIPQSSRSAPAYAGGIPPAMAALGPRRARVTGANYITLDQEQATLAAAEGISSYVWGGSGLISKAMGFIGSSGSGSKRRWGKRQQNADPQLKLHPPTQWVYPNVLTQDGVNYTREGVDPHGLKYKSEAGVELDFSVDECTPRLFCQTDLDCGGGAGSTCYCAPLKNTNAPIALGQPESPWGTCARR